MSALLERVRSATGPDRELDESIAYEVRFRPDATHDKLGSFAHHEAKYGYDASWIAHTIWRGQWGIPNYSASVDSALSLADRMLPGCRFALYTNGGGKGPACLVMRGDEPVLADEHAATLPLAIVAAALLAYNNEPPER